MPCSRDGNDLFKGWKCHISYRKKALERIAGGIEINRNVKIIHSI